MKINKYFRGFTPKAITFSIDDGSPKWDDVFLDIVRPAGIKGTFNLFPRSDESATEERLRERYEGYEIANHCKWHPCAFNVEREYRISDEPFNIETSDKDFIYKTGREGVYHLFQGSSWRTLADNDAYLKLIDEGKEYLEGIFGAGSVKGFVWPYGRQKNPELFEAIKNRGYNSMRRGDMHPFNLPTDRMEWGVTAYSTNLLERMAEFDALEDDGELKFFCFGLHAVDFERNGKWEELKSFARDYGNRPNDFWYATVSEIFEYEDAMNSLQITDGKIINPSDKELYISIDGKRYVVSPTSELTI